MKTKIEIQEKMVNLERAINEINRAIREDFEEATTYQYSKAWEQLWAAHHLGESLTGIKLALVELINQYYNK